MKKAILSLILLLAGVSAYAQPAFGTKVYRDSNGIVLLKGDDGSWVILQGTGAPTLTTYIGESVPNKALYFNLTTAGAYTYSNGTWTLSSAGAASSITPATTTVGTSTNCFNFADASSLLQCDNAFAYISNAGAGNGLTSVNKTAGNNYGLSFLRVAGTLLDAIAGGSYGTYFQYATAGTGVFDQGGLQVNITAGATGAAVTTGVYSTNSVAAVNAGNYLAAGGNRGGYFAATGASGGAIYNTGVSGIASGGGKNTGGFFGATVAVGTQAIGVVGQAANGSTSNTGVFAVLGGSLLTPVSGALVANNGAVAAPIAVFQDNSTTFWQIKDGGPLTGRDAVGGTDTDTAGGPLVVTTGLGTGTGAGGDVNIQRSIDTTTGSVQQVAADAIYIRSKKKALVAATATPFARINIASGVAAVTGWTGGTVFYSLVANDAADFQSRSGSINFSVVNKAGAETCAFAAIPTESVANSSGTTTLTFDTDVAGPTNGCDLRATGASSLTETTLSFFYTIVLSGPGTVTPQ